MSVRKFIAAMLAVFACSIAARARAQETTGTIAGRIVDAQGLAIPGASVTATGPQGSKTAHTDADGRFSIPFLTPGAYAIHAELDGFTPADRSAVHVRLG